MSDGLYHIVCHAKSGKPGGVATPQSATVNAGMRNRLLAVNALNNNDDGTHEPKIMGARVPMPRRASVLRTGFDKLKTRCIHHGQGSSSSKSHDTMASNHPLQLRLSSIVRQLIHATSRLTALRSRRTTILDCQSRHKQIHAVRPLTSLGPTRLFLLHAPQLPSSWNLLIHRRGSLVTPMSTLASATSKRLRNASVDVPALLLRLCCMSSPLFHTHSQLCSPSASRSRMPASCASYFWFRAVSF